MIDPVTVSAFGIVYEVVKYWLPILGAAFGLFKVVNWVKSNLININSGVNNLNHGTNSLKEELQNQTKTFAEEVTKQTHAFVTEVKELRSDFRTFYVPALLSQQQFASKPLRALKARAKKAPVAKKKAKR